MEDNNNNKLMIRKIIVDHDPFDVTFYFEGSDDPWSAEEFDSRSKTHHLLKQIENQILFSEEQ